MSIKIIIQIYFEICNRFTIAWVPEFDPDLMYNFVGIVVWLSNVEVDDNTTDLFSAEIHETFKIRLD